jgi:hypothetical protein
MSLVAISIRREEFARGLATSRRDLQSHVVSSNQCANDDPVPAKLWRDKITTKAIKIDQRIARSRIRPVHITDGPMGVTGD